jgi:transposase
MGQIGIKLKEHLSSEELKERYRKCKNAKEARRWHALWLMSEGASTIEAARAVGFQDSWVRRFANRYNEQGPEAIRDHHQINPGGGKYRLTEKQQQQLARALEKEPPGGGLWNGPKVATWIAEKTGRPARPKLGWVYLLRLAMSGQLPRRRHTEAASEGERNNFKKS